LKKVKLLPYDVLKKLYPEKEAKINLRNKALTTVDPTSKGCGVRLEILINN